MNKFFAAVALSALTIGFTASQMQAAEIASTVAPTAKTEQATPVVKKHPVSHHVVKSTKSPIQKVSDSQPVTKPEAKSTETKSTEAKPVAKVEEKKTDVKAQPQIGQAPAASATTTAPVAATPVAPVTPAPVAPSTTK